VCNADPTLNDAIITTFVSAFATDAFWFLADGHVRVLLQMVLLIVVLLLVVSFVTDGPSNSSVVTGSQWKWELVLLIVVLLLVVSGSGSWFF
jgi:hypothetical protein